MPTPPLPAAESALLIAAEAYRKAPDETARAAYRDWLLQELNRCILATAAAELRLAEVRWAAGMTC